MGEVREDMIENEVMELNLQAGGAVLQAEVRVGRREGPSRKRKHCIPKHVSMGMEQVFHSGLCCFYFREL